MEHILTSKIADGWSGIINDNGNIITYGAYINKLGQLVIPTLHYEFGKKHNKTNYYDVKNVIISAKPNDNIEPFVDITPLSEKIARLTS